MDLSARNTSMEIRTPSISGHHHSSPQSGVEGQPEEGDTWVGVLHVQDEANDILYEMACHCEELFDELRSAAAGERVLVDICAEYQSRFAIWAAHIGVFARKSQCLDTRLRGYPELQDLCTRLLGILQQSLQQCVDYGRQPTGSESYQDMLLDEGHCNQPTSVRRQRLESLKAVEGTLSRLNRLGVTIRQSSGAKAITRARRFAETLDLEYFKSLCSAAVQFLYSGAHQSLKAHLSRLMIALYARIQHLESRRRNLETRRAPAPRLATINEAPANVNATAGPSRQETIPPVFRHTVPPRSRGPMSQSDLSSVQMSHILDSLRVPEQASTTFPKTFSIRVNQANYPRPPEKEGNSIRCKWCSEWLREEDLVGSAWRRHVDRDLNPYACLAEQCTEVDAVFPSFEAWFKHMQLHGQRWHQENYQTTSWNCVVCGDRHVYNNPQDLCSHMEKLHRDTFTPSHLPAIARQSRVQHRAANTCLLCCFTVEPEEEVRQEAGSLKRPGPRQTGEGTKSARTSRSMTSPGPKTIELDLADSASSSDSDEQELADISGLPITMARHIAAHLQILMLVTLRLDELQNRDGNACDEVQSNDAEFDEDDSFPANDDSRQSSDIVSPNDFTMEADDEFDGDMGKATVMDCDNTMDHMPIPDTNLDLSDVPRSYDGLEPKDDRFMAQIIEDKAFQSWTDLPEVASAAAARQTMRSAFEDLEKVITPQNSMDYRDCSLERARQETLDIELKLTSRKSLRNMRRLEPLFTGLEYYSTVVEVLCNGTPFLSWIWAPIILILRITSVHVESFDCFIGAYSRLGSSLQRFEVLSKSFFEDPKFHGTTAAFYVDILEFHKQAYKFVQRSGWKVFFSTSWGRLQRRFDNILANMKRHEDLIEQQSPASGHVFEDVSSTDTIGPSLEIPDSRADEIVCFGTILGINAEFYRSGCSDLPQTFSVDLLSLDQFTSTEKDLGVRGRIRLDHGRMIQDILAVPTLELEVSCSIVAPNSSALPDRSITQVSCSLAITLYGPLELFEDIGAWLEYYHMPLQDPVNVGKQDVKYCNPHRLSCVEDIDSCVLVSTRVSQNSGLSIPQITEDQSDFFNILSSHADLEEASQPEAVRTSLKRHQKQALTFMLRREKSWAFDKISDIWEARDTYQGLGFLNKVSGAISSEEPPAFRGGIIADPMGFGKTLMMIALAATDLESEREPFPVDDVPVEKIHNGATLIIVPPPLLFTWQEQLHEHMFDGRLPVRIHHGKTKLVDLRDLEKVTIVLTTYHTASAEFKSGGGMRESSILFSTHWRRIILDEAHFIHNENTQMARAVCDLRSSARWAVTCTPFLNHLNDLSTLLKFIRAYPYHEPKQFKADISSLWKLGEDEKAINRLKYLSASLILRRPKTIMSLPSRRDIQCPVEFNSEERKVYDEARSQATTAIGAALHSGSGASESVSHVNVLQLIESLRLICNLGTNYHPRHKGSIEQSQNDWISLAQRIFNTRRELDPISCIHCSSDIELSDSQLDPSDGKRSGQFFRCLKFCCGECVDKAHRLGGEVACGHAPHCLGATVSLVGKETEEGESLDAAELQTGLKLPSKLQALVTDIQSLPMETKCVVFSTWRLTLDLVQAGLNQHSIANVRMDGKVPLKDRQTAVNRFNTDPDTRVMLLTLSCGAVGLTLTAASRAYLTEPQWNPTLEEQALARIHRIGQTNEVTTIRFYVRDSIEEYVMSVQTAKKELLGLLLAPLDSANTNDRLAALDNIKSLL